MYKDKLNTRASDSSQSICLETPTEKDNYSRDTEDKKHWKIKDTITHEDGTVEIKQHVNTVVDDCSNLIACLMKGQEGYKGIAYWAVGAGEDHWSDEKPPTPTVNDHSLVKETFRKKLEADNIKFLDERDEVSESVTNKLSITVFFDKNEALGALREFALFGGNATGVKDSGIMINRKTHGLIYKSKGMTLKREIIISF